MLGNGLFHGMYNPAMVWPSDHCVKLDGINDYVQVTGFNGISSAHQSSIGNVGSFSLWFTGLDAASDQTIFYFSCSGGKFIHVIYRHEDDIIEIGRSDTDGNEPHVSQKVLFDMTDSQLQSRANHLVVSWNAGSVAAIPLTATLQGVSLEADSDSAEWSESTISRLYYGTNGTSGNEFSGQIHNVALFNTDLDATRRTDIYNQGVPKNEAYHPNIIWYHTASEKDWQSSTIQRTTVANRHGLTFGKVEYVNGALWATRVY